MGATADLEIAPVFAVAWPSGEFGGMALRAAVRLAVPERSAAIEDVDARDAELRRQVVRMYTKRKALAVASIVEIGNMAETSRWISRGLKSPRPRTRVGMWRSFVDTW